MKVDVILPILIVFLLVFGGNCTKKKIDKGMFLASFVFLILVVFNKAVIVKRNGFPLEKDKKDLYEYIYTNTEKDAVFLIPVGIEDFRLGAGRAIVVDFKAYPFLDASALEWYRRVLAVRNFYKNSNCDSLEKLKESYWVDYFLIPNTKKESETGDRFLPCGNLIYKDDFWFLYSKER